MGFQPFPVFGRGLRRGFGRGNDGGSHITSMLSRILTTQPASLIGYWPLGDLTGTVADDISPTNADGAYVAPFSLAQPGIGDGSKSTLFTGGRVDLSANLAIFDTPFDPTIGSLLVWVQVLNNAFWTDGNFHVFSALGADVNNRILLYKTNVNNQIQFFYTAGGVGFTVPVTFSSSAPFSMEITWNKAANKGVAYLNGVQQGSIQTVPGIWAGALNSSWSGIGSQSSIAASSSHSGWLSHNACWKIDHTPAEAARIGTLSAS